MLALGEGVEIRVKFMLTHFKQLEKEIVYERYKNHHGTNLGIRSIGKASDPTYNEAENEMSDVKVVILHDGTIVHSPCEWLRIIKYVYENISVSDSRLMQMYFFDGQPWAEVIAELEINKDTFYRRRDKIVSLVSIAAAQAGLVEIMPMN
jgi:hypothetical protein